MKKNIIIIIVLVIAVIAVLAYKSNHAPAPSTNIPGEVTVENISGCYVAMLSKDVYTLHITSQQGEVVSGTLAFKNFEKDSSNGTFSGTYKKGILLADYTFNSEGMQSVRQVIFKKIENGLVEGFGNVTTIGDREVFVDPSTVAYDSNATFIISTTCTSATTTPVSLTQTYKSSTYKFTLNYPALYTVDRSYTYQALGPGKDIHGVKFTIDPSLAKGTNLSTDSYISVESMPHRTSCSATSFVSDGTKATTITDNGVTYSFAKTGDAGAGNRYDETVYALPGTNSCLAVRYFIHYGVIENYPPTVKAFDKKALTDQFDQIRKTLILIK
jgi:hypothetical protein